MAVFHIHTMRGEAEKYHVAGRFTGLHLNLVLIYHVEDVRDSGSGFRGPFRTLRSSTLQCHYDHSQRSYTLVGLSRVVSLGR